MRGRRRMGGGAREPVWRTALYAQRSRAPAQVQMQVLAQSGDGHPAMDMEEEDEDEEKEKGVVTRPPSVDPYGDNGTAARAIALAYLTTPGASDYFITQRPLRQPFTHQATGAAFLVGRARKYQGTLLCDLPRMGKSGTCILAMHAMIQEQVARGQPRFGQPDLVVCPNDVLPVWPAEVAAMLGEQTLAVRVLVTASVPTDKEAAAAFVTRARHELLEQTDVLVTTYSTLTSTDRGGLRTMLAGLRYRLVYCDEAHAMRHDDALAFQIVTQLQCQARIYMSGTPVQNDLGSLLSALRFIGVHVDERALMAGAVNETEVFDRVRALTAPHMLRRGGGGGDGDASMPSSPPRPRPPPLVDELGTEPLPTTPMAFATILETQAYAHLGTVLRPLLLGRPTGGGRRTQGIPVRVIHWLRRACISMELLRDKFASGELTLPAGMRLSSDVPTGDPIRRYTHELAVRVLTAEAIGAATDRVWDEARAEVLGAAPSADAAQIWDGMAQRVAALRHELLPPVGTKERWFCGYLCPTVMERRQEKVVVYSNWVAVLERIGQLLDLRRRLGIPHAAGYAMTHGDMPPEQRQRERQRFWDDPQCLVLLSTIPTSNMGINLTCARHVVIWDPWWNPQPEIQAINRVYGPTQTHEVFIYRLMVLDSIDEYVVAHSDNKLRFNQVVPVTTAEEDNIARTVLLEHFNQAAAHAAPEPENNKDEKEEQTDGMDICHSSPAHQ